MSSRTKFRIVNTKNLLLFLSNVLKNKKKNKKINDIANVSGVKNHRPCKLILLFRLAKKIIEEIDK